MSHAAEALLARIREADGSPRVGSSETLFTIGELCREFQLSLRALRFYEQRGLIAPRRRGGMRVYNQADRARLALILRGKRLGFTLAEIQRMLAPQGAPVRHSLRLSREKCVEQIRLLEGQKREIDAALAELRRNYSEPYRAAFAPGIPCEPERRS